MEGDAEPSTLENVVKPFATPHFPDPRSICPWELSTPNSPNSPQDSIRHPDRPAAPEPPSPRYLSPDQPHLTNSTSQEFYEQPVTERGSTGSPINPESCSGFNLSMQPLASTSLLLPDELSRPLSSCSNSMEHREHGPSVSTPHAHDIGLQAPGPSPSSLSWLVRRPSTSRLSGGGGGGGAPALISDDAFGSPPYLGNFYSDDNDSGAVGPSSSEDNDDDEGMPSLTNSTSETNSETEDTSPYAAAPLPMELESFLTQRLSSVGMMEIHSSEPAPDLARLPSFNELRSGGSRNNRGPVPLPSSLRGLPASLLWTYTRGQQRVHEEEDPLSDIEVPEWARRFAPRSFQEEELQEPATILCSASVDDTSLVMAQETTGIQNGVIREQGPTAINDLGPTAINDLGPTAINDLGHSASLPSTPLQHQQVQQHHSQYAEPCSTAAGAENGNGSDDVPASPPIASVAGGQSMAFGGSGSSSYCGDDDDDDDDDGNSDEDSCCPSHHDPPLSNDDLGRLQRPFRLSHSQQQQRPFRLSHSQQQQRPFRLSHSQQHVSAPEGDVGAGGLDINVGGGSGEGERSGDVIDRSSNNSHASMPSLVNDSSESDDGVSDWDIPALVDPDSDSVDMPGSPSSRSHSDNGDEGEDGTDSEASWETVSETQELRVDLDGMAGSQTVEDPRILAFATNTAYRMAWGSFMTPTSQGPLSEAPPRSPLLPEIRNLHAAGGRLRRPPLPPLPGLSLPQSQESERLSSPWLPGSLAARAQTAQTPTFSGYPQYMGSGGGEVSNSRGPAVSPLSKPNRTARWAWQLQLMEHSKHHHYEATSQDTSVQSSYVSNVGRAGLSDTQALHSLLSSLPGVDLTSPCLKEALSSLSATAIESPTPTCNQQ